MTTLEINGTQYETVLDLPSGDIELTTLHPVVFWCISKDPSVRHRDYRTELQRLHAGVPVHIANVPDGWKIAISLRPDLPAVHRERPKPPLPPAPPALTEEEMEALRLSKQVAKDMERAELVNEAYDLVMARLMTPAPAPVIQEPERARDELLDFDAEPVEELTGDQLLSAFEQDEEAAALLVQTLSALRQKHISEQLNVERARLDREHQATGVANPRSAQIDRLLGLLTRRGEV